MATPRGALRVTGTACCAALRRVALLRCSMLRCSCAFHEDGINYYERYRRSPAVRLPVAFVAQETIPPPLAHRPLPVCQWAVGCSVGAPLGSRVKISGPFGKQPTADFILPLDSTVRGADETIQQFAASCHPRRCKCQGPSRCRQGGGGPSPAGCRCAKEAYISRATPGGPVQMWHAGAVAVPASSSPRWHDRWHTLFVRPTSADRSMGAWVGACLCARVSARARACVSV